MNKRSQDRGLSIVGPFVLIGLGIVLLLQQLDLIQWSLMDVAFRLWPLIIIAVGADILLARRSFLGAVASLLVVLALFLGGLYWMGRGARGGEKLSSEEVVFPLEDSSKGSIDLSMDAGELDIDALAQTSNNVIEGTIHQAYQETVTTEHSIANGNVVVSIRNKWPRFYVASQGDDFIWNLGLTRRVPLELDFSMGAGQIVADLTNLKVTSVDVQLGAGQLILKLPANSNISVSVKIGAGDAEIYLPEGAAVDIDCTTAVGNCALPNGSGFWGQSYTSPDYAASDYKIQIEVNVAVGEARVEL